MTASAEDRGSVARNSFALRIAELGYRFLPRGKAAFARAVGRALIRDGYLLVPSHQGITLAIPAQSLDMAAFLRVHRDWDDHVIDALAPLAAAGGTFYDVGANLGYISLSLARRGSAKGLATFAFEPNPKLASAVRLAAEANALPVTVFQLALDESSGTVEFFVPKHAIHASLVSRSAHATSISVQRITLDELVESGKAPAPTFMKIDVEGAEFRLFKGAERTLRAHLPTIVYECDSNLDRFGASREQVEDLLRSYGYRSIRRLRDASGGETDDYLASAGV
jgi:FkbM family methyltransferase